MGATVPAGNRFPITSAWLSNAGRRRIKPPMFPLPKDATVEQVREALNQLSASLYDDPKNEVTDHLRMLTEGVNIAAAAALTPVTTQTVLAADVNVGATTVWVALTALAQTIYTPIPARLYLSLDVQVNTPGAGLANAADLYRVRILVNGAQVAQGVWAPGIVVAATLRTHLALIGLVGSVLPEAAYAVTVEHGMTGAGGTVFSTRATDTKLCCRVEARSLA
ncbi:MAG: hypothetical protein A2190_08995 [Lysobacterales bacterium RIFOXYA1_FULL_69_10]|nr:MAG: hypothetical protein A2190_08995 [Xanthomonadales bacterium RIFOXYA1_FULL_69_10]